MGSIYGCMQPVTAIVTPRSAQSTQYTIKPTSDDIFQQSNYPSYISRLLDIHLSSIKPSTKENLSTAIISQSTQRHGKERSRSITRSLIGVSTNHYRSLVYTNSDKEVSVAQSPQIE